MPPAVLDVCNLCFSLGSLELFGLERTEQLHVSTASPSFLCPPGGIKFGTALLYECLTISMAVFVRIHRKSQEDLSSDACFCVKRRDAQIRCSIMFVLVGVSLKTLS